MAQLLLQLHIGTRSGVRVEYIRVQPRLGGVATMMMMMGGGRPPHSPPPPPPTIMAAEEEEVVVAGRKRPGRRDEAPSGRVASTGRLRMVVLHHANDFTAGRVRVRCWGSAACSATAVTAARFRLVAHPAEREYDATDDSASGDDDDDGPPSVRRPRTMTTMMMPSHPRTHHPASRRRHKKQQDHRGTKKKEEEEEEEAGGWLELDMTDSDSGEVAYVWVMVHPYHDDGADSLSGTLRRSIPHPAHPFRIENTCGACRTPFALDLSAYRCLRPAALRGATGDLITMLSGTFAPCASRMQVDFRGVRSIAAMRRDWERIAGVGPADTGVTVYMLVMKACLGVPALIVDGGTLPAGLEGLSARLAEEGRRRCYLGERMAPYCGQHLQHVDVCQAIELQDIRWGALCAGRPTPVDPLLLGGATTGLRSSVHVSRRGGAMLRLIFPGGTPWDEAREASVLRDCNHLMAALQRALLGHPL